MINWFKKLFCKHEYIIEVARQFKPTAISENEIGAFVKSECLLGVIVICPRCGKEKKRIAKFIQKCEARKMMVQVEKEMEKVQENVVNMFKHKD